MTNRELAKRLVAEADAHMTDRKALLCAAVVADRTSSIPAAIKALREWDGPAEVVGRAMERLQQEEGTSHEGTDRDR
jgi:hypothetical protein